MDRLGVIPVESPTVENAETVSNAIGIRPLLPSLILRINIAIKMVDAEKRKMEKALLRSSAEIVLLPISILFCPLIVLIAEYIINVNVDVLIPPPVDPGDAPINIKNMKIMSIGVLIIEKSTVLKPAVLAVIE